jgi:hypothetical protein
MFTDMKEIEGDSAIVVYVLHLLLVKRSFVAGFSANK